MQFDASHIHQNKKFWQALLPEELDQYEQFLFEHYRAVGYPGYTRPSQTEMKKSVATTMKYLDSDQGRTLITDSGEVRQTMHLLSDLWSYYPHYTSVRCAGSPSLDENWHNDKTLRTVIHKRLKYGDYMGDSAIRKAFRAYGSQVVSNFRPTAAAALYRRYAPENAVVLDMCGGYGGRLAGAMLSGRVSRYEFNEPDLRTLTGSEIMYKDLKAITGSSMTIEGSSRPAEDEQRPLNRYDMVFTSPPYFNTERYSEDETQSCIRYPVYTMWLECFLYQMLKNALEALKPGGYFLLNIASVKSAPTLAEDAFNLLKDDLNLRHETTLQYALSGRSGNVTAGKFRYEPVFVMKKE